MVKGDRGIAIRRLDALLRAGTVGGMSDAELLERFAGRRDEAAEMAFGALVMRHGAMVHRVCRGVLRDSHEADDAFQATFLVLVRRAGSLWVRDSLGPWLHQTAYRTASRARCAAARRRQHEGRAAESTARSTDDAERDDVGDVVHEEINWLPQRYRAAVVLCLVEGRTPEQAARDLGCPVGTVHSRLARGRARLRSRLTGRGVAIPAVLLTATIPRAASAALSPSLVDAAVQAAMGTTTGRGAAAGITSAITDTLTRQVTRIMLMNKIKLAATVVLSVGLVTGGGVLSRIGATTSSPSQEPPKENEATAPPSTASDAQEAATEPVARPTPTAAKSKAYVFNDAVQTVAYSPDGRTIAASGSDGVIRLWDGVTGEKRTALEGPALFARGLAFSPGGETVAGACNDKIVSIWNAKTGEVKSTFSFFSQSMQAIASPRASACSVVFSPDGKRLAAGGCDGAIIDGKAFYQIRMFEADSGRLIWEHIGRDEWVSSLAFSSDGKTLAHGGSMTARLWDAETGDLKQVLKPERGSASEVSFSSDGKLLAGGGTLRRREADEVQPPGQVTIWDATTGERLRTLIGPTGTTRAVAFAPDGYAVACGGYGRVHVTTGERRWFSEVTLWDAASGELKWTWEGRGADVTSLAFSPDGKALAVCNADEFGLVDVATGKTTRILMKTTRR